MKRVFYILLLIIFAFSNGYSYHINLTQQQKNYVIGTLFLTVEYITVPLYMKHIWWEDGWELKNPFSNIDEREPYHVDESWHAAMNGAMQEIHYLILKKYFNIENPFPSMALTSFTWFMVEVLDAIEVNDRWGFSLNDEYGNLLGILTWYLRFKYPKFRVYIRGGIRKWSNAIDYVEYAPNYFLNHTAYDARYAAEKYAISKVEYIYINFINNTILV